MNKSPEILLIEDNPEEVFLIKTYLKSKNASCRFIEFTKGEEVVKFIATSEKKPFLSHPNLIILDLKLPTIDGIELIKKLKLNGPLTCIPIVVFTGSNAPKDILDAYKNYANSFVIKPQEQEHYIKVLDGIWDFWFGTVKLPNITKYA